MGYSCKQWYLAQIGSHCPLYRSDVKHIGDYPTYLIHNNFYDFYEASNNFYENKINKLLQEAFNIIYL